jgi:Tfp pilus assembly protein PilF
MKRTGMANRGNPVVTAGVALCFVFVLASASLVPGSPALDEIRILESQGVVELSTDGGARWVLTQTNQLLKPPDRLRTGPNSRVVLRWSDQSVVPFGAMTEIEVLPPHRPEAQSGLRLFRGLFSFFHRDRPGRIRVVTRGAVAGVEGTEFVVSVATVNDVERTTLSVIDGVVELANRRSALVLTNGQQAIVDEDAAPLRTPGFIANNVLQWSFYYPGVLDVRDLPLAPEEQQALSESLAAYRAGDLLAALAQYPATRPPASDADRVYHAALLLSVGQVEQTEAVLAALPAGDPADRLPRLANALRQLIAAVKRQPVPSNLNPQLATELLATSYSEQSRAVRDTALRSALALARQAASSSPEFGFAWARVAELEFGFGRTRRAQEALDRSLTFSPRNAQAMAIKGFLLAAQNKTRDAIDWFNQAIAADSHLGNAWLGRGLCRIRRGDRPGGREDLLVAAALEPQRAFLRSYLGKAYGDTGDRERAHHELALAKRLDPADPTAWLYSALLLQQENRINEAVDELEQSQALNDNRRLYRSTLLLDQDRAVRSSSLANIYRDAGMTEWSVLEAGRAVSADYANYSAHLFLANSYDELRDPNRINLRYETPAESEYLIANLLAPVGAGLLAQSVSQQEYSKLFERDRLGVSSSTEYLSRGAWVEHGAQFGTFGNSSYLFEGLYRWDPGQRPNNDFESRDLRLHLKQQATARDTFYLRGIDYEAEAGDVLQHPKPSLASHTLRTKETQRPILHAGYHHEWNPGLHTLLLVGRLSDDFGVTNRLHPTYFLLSPQDEPPTDFELMWTSLRYRADVEIYSAEWQQIQARGDHHTVAGARAQMGEIRTAGVQRDQVVLGEINGFFQPGVPLAKQRFGTDVRHFAGYAYHHWQFHPALQLIGGVAYNRVSFPANFLAPPLTGREADTDQVSPKAGLVWTPGVKTTVRLAYARALTGVSSEQSYALEPTQVAGMNQSFRSVIPESRGGSSVGAKLEMLGAVLERKLGPATYLGVSGQVLNSDERRSVGVFRYDDAVSFYAQPSSTRQDREYREHRLVLLLHHLVQDQWGLSFTYRLTHATLESNFPEVLNSGAFTLGVQPRSEAAATLHQLLVQANHYHPSGLFWSAHALWSRQNNHDYELAASADEDFWQFNVFAGYRLPGRRAELRLGVLNLADQDYRLNPLTLYNDLARSRTLSVRFQLQF